MYNRLALKITNWFIAKKIIDESKKSIYAYGFEVIISGLVYFTIFIVCSIISSSLTESIFFWLGLFALRRVAGGFHAATYKLCHIIFEANHILFILILNFIPNVYYKHITISILLFTIICVLIWAPVDHKNKPFIKTEHKRFKTYSRIYCVIILIIGVLHSVNLIPFNKLLFSFSIGTLSATISLLIAKIIRNKERKVDV